jgi:hypothetical protein
MVPLMPEILLINATEQKFRVAKIRLSAVPKEAIAWLNPLLL